MNSLIDYKQKYEYFKKFEVVLNGGLEGYEIPFLKTPFGKRCEKDKVLSAISDLSSRLLMKEGYDPLSRISLYEDISKLIIKKDKNIFLPYKEEGFNELWTEKEIKIFDKIIVPSADFYIYDVCSPSNINSILFESAKKNGIPQVFIDKDEKLFKLLISRGVFEEITFPYKKITSEEDYQIVYPIVSNDENDILKKLEIFLEKFYSDKNKHYQ